MRAHVCTSIAALHDGHKCHSPSTPPDTANQSPSCKAPVLLGRRACLGAAALSIYLSTQQSKSIAADRDPPVLIDALPEQDIRGLTSLQADMVTRGIPQNPGPSFAVTKKQKQLFYPPWLQVCGDEVVVTIAPPTTVPPQGTWQAEGRLVGIAFPQGGQMLSPSVPGFTKGSLIAAIADVGVGQDAPIAMRMRWVDSPQEGGVVADREYNIAQQVDAFFGEPSVRSVRYTPLDDPTRVSVEYATGRKDTAPASPSAPAATVDLRRAELFINNRRSQQPSDNVFVCSELYRQVNQAKRQGSVGDYEVFWEFTRQEDGTVVGRQRVAAYLQPQDAAYFDSASRAVATYDYRYMLSKV